MQKILFGTDFHGSEVCFRKLFNLAPRVKPDLIVLGGDLCGKALVPIVRRNDTHEAEFMNQRLTGDSEDEVKEIERRIRFHGFYPIRIDPDRLAALHSDADLREQAFRDEMVRTVERWIGIAEEKLEENSVPCVSLPGNDDDWAIDGPLNASERIVNCDGRLVDAGEFQVMGFGPSNETPWNSPREMPEEEIRQELASIARGADADRPLVANIHVPPYRSTLDEAPLVDEDLRPVRKGGNPVVGPVGSHGVREFIEHVHPTVSFHGHVHESRNATRINDTLAVNPGSDYSSGTLQAVIVTIDPKERKVRGHQFVSG